MTAIMISNNCENHSTFYILDKNNTGWPSATDSTECPSVSVLPFISVKNTGSSQPIPSNHDFLRCSTTAKCGTHTCPASRHPVRV